MDIYVDGSFGDGWLNESAGVGIHFVNDNRLNCSITVIGNSMYTMDIQGAEAIAIYIALAITKSVPDVTIYSDSQHCVTSLTKRYNEFKKNGWRTQKKRLLAHYKILQSCGSIIDQKVLNNQKINIKQVSGHSGIKGNEIAHLFAYRAMIDGQNIENCNTFVLPLGLSLYELVSESAELTKIHELINIRHKFPEVIKGVHTNYCNSENNSSYTMTTRDLYKYYFIACISCTSVVMIKQFDYSEGKTTSRRISKDIFSSVTFTTCASCMLLSKSEQDYHTTIKLEEQLNSLNINDSMFIQSKIVKVAEDIPDTDSSILVENNSINYVTIDNISKLCTNDSTASSIDILTCTVLPYLRLGFFL